MTNFKFKDDHITLFIIWFLCFALMFGILLSVRYRDLIGTLAPPKFSVVRGQIIESRVKAQGGKDGITYFPVVRYKCSVGVRWFENDLISFRAEGGSQDKAQSISNRYFQGSRVQIYYDPTNPRFSVLQPNRTTGRKDILFLGVLMGIDVVLLSLIFVAIYQKRHRTSNQVSLLSL